jgi:outer membrane protein
MANLGCILLVIFGLALTPRFAGAAEFKMGFVNVQDILSKSSEWKKVQDNLKHRAEAMGRPLQQRGQDLGRQLQEFEKQAAVMKEEARKRKQEELQKKMTDFQKQASDAERQLAQYEQREKEPVLKKLEQAVKEVAQENKLDLVLDTLNPGLLYANPSFDVTEKVRSRFGH